MKSRSQRLVPFIVAAIVLFIVCLALFRLPDAFAAKIERNSPFTSSQSGWAYRLLALAAIAQALYIGFVILQVDRVRKAQKEDPQVAAMTSDEQVRTLSRNAAGMSLLTLVYGLAAFYVSGERGGFWLFVFLAVAQLAWYYRQVGQVERWLELQPAPDPNKPRRESAWQREPPDYSPPLGR